MLRFKEGFYYFKDDAVLCCEKDVSKGFYDRLLEDLVIQRDALSIEEVCN